MPKKEENIEEVSSCLRKKEEADDEKTGQDFSFEKVFSVPGEEKNIQTVWLEAFRELGGMEGLVAWAKKNPSEFYKTSTKLFSITDEEKKEEGPTQILVKFED